jgi:hypothetical protein
MAPRSKQQPDWKRNKLLTSFNKPITALPRFFEPRPDACTLGLGHIGSGGLIGVGEAGGFQFGQFQQLAVAQQIGYAELG